MILHAIALGADVSTGANFGPDGALDNGDSIKIHENGINVLLNAADRQINGVHLDGKNGAILTVSQDTQLGVIGGGNGNGNLANLVFGGNKTVTFNGKLGFTALAANDYSSLGEINFADRDAVLKIDADADGAITLANASVATANAGEAELDVDTDLTVNHASFAKIRQFKIADNKTLKFGTDAAGIADDITTIAGSAWDLAENSKVEFNMDTTAANRTITLGAELSGGDNDKRGVITFGAYGSKKLTIAGANIGNADDKRLTELKLVGGGDIEFTANKSVFAKKITVDNAATTTFKGVVNGGDDSTLEFAAAGSVKFANTVTGDVDFATHKGTVEIVGDKTLTGNITNTGAGE